MLYHTRRRRRPDVPPSHHRAWTPHYTQVLHNVTYASVPSTSFCLRPTTVRERVRHVKSSRSVPVPARVTLYAPSPFRRSTRLRIVSRVPSRPHMDRMNRRRRPLPVHIVLVALLLPAACVSSEPAVGHTCPMNVSEPVAAAEARLVDGTLHVGDPPGRVYDTAQFRSAPNGSGYELCTCVLKRCVVKCCRQGHVWNGTCTKHDDYGSLGPLMVSTRQRWSLVYNKSWHMNVNVK